mmetsp:Transcript_3018/g.10076  ORF Transcript_3018/g.10076 Transcript_3018/m.10076 type:complete len:338 (+) Transcript_3018:289-1302(+)
MRRGAPRAEPEPSRSAASLSGPGGNVEARLLRQVLPGRGALPVWVDVAALHGQGRGHRAGFGVGPRRPAARLRAGDRHVVRHPGRHGPGTLGPVDLPIAARQDSVVVPPLQVQAIHIQEAHEGLRHFDDGLALRAVSQHADAERPRRVVRRDVEGRVHRLAGLDGHQSPRHRGSATGQLRWVFGAARVKFHEVLRLDVVRRHLAAHRLVEGGALARLRPDAAEDELRGELVVDRGSHGGVVVEPEVEPEVLRVRPLLHGARGERRHRDDRGVHEVGRHGQRRARGADEAEGTVHQRGELRVARRRRLGDERRQLRAPVGRLGLDRRGALSAAHRRRQ